MSAVAAPAARLCEICVRARPRLLRRLAHAWPGTCSGLLEDALCHALLQHLEALGRPESLTHRVLASGEARRVEGLLYLSAWRQLRGEGRRPARRLEQAVAVPPEATHTDDPHALLVALRTAARLRALAPVAARRHGPGAAAALTGALLDRLEHGGSDVATSARFGVERSVLCRARLWLEQEGSRAAEIG